MDCLCRSDDIHRLIWQSCIFRRAINHKNRGKGFHTPCKDLPEFPIGFDGVNLLRLIRQMFGENACSCANVCNTSFSRHPRGFNDRCHCLRRIIPAVFGVFFRFGGIDGSWVLHSAPESSVSGLSSMSSLAYSSLPMKRPRPSPSQMGITLLRQR